MNIVLWGIGNNANKLLSQVGLYQSDNIVALIDMDPQKWGIKIKNLLIESPEILKNIYYEKIIICPEKRDEIKKIIKEEYNINEKCIDTIDYFYKKLFRHLKSKYNCTCDEEIKRMLDDFEKNGPSVWGSYKGKRDFYLIYRDDENHPYIIFMEKRMYFPDDYCFPIKNNKEYIENILWEQNDDSPHRYIESEIDRKKISGGVIIDAGVREGNFALQYVEDARKLYLIESDQRWLNALEKTFRPFRNKVILCDKFLSRENDRDHIRLDTLVSEKIDFLKMDIEGYEIDAILGGKRILSKSDAKCAICSYHNMSDEENIHFLMNSLGYETTVSKGYMFFLYDQYLFDHLDFRKGIVYASKK